MAVDIAQARALITVQTAGEQELTQLQNRIRQLQGDLGNTSGGLQKLTVSAGQQKFAMRDLAFQIGDVSTQFASGTPVMQIFAQQGSQVVGALQMMTGQTSGLLGFLAGPWGMILSSAAIALTPLIAKLFETGDAAKNAKQQVDVLKSALADIKTKPMETLGKLQSDLMLAQGALRNAQNTPVKGRGETIARAQAIKDAELAVQEAEANFKIAQQVQKNTAAMAATAPPKATREVRPHVTKAGKDLGEEFSKLFWQNFSKDFGATVKDVKKNLPQQMKADNDNFRDWLAGQRANQTQPFLDAAAERAKSFGGGMQSAFEGYADSIGSMGERSFSIWNKAISGTEDALVNFAMTGKLSVKSLANSIIADLARVAIQEAIMKPLTTALGIAKYFGYAKGGAFSGGNVIASAMGNVFGGGNVKAFATGGIVGSPTLFPMAGGRTGLMGEAGPEAIVPLRRTSSGRLGIEASGGGNTQVSVSVDASGSAVEGNSQNASQLGKAIGAAVQAELVRQKRPGGLLAA